MCEIIDKLLSIMKPFVENIENDLSNLNEKKDYLIEMNDIITNVDNDVFNLLDIDDDKIELYLDNIESNKNEYLANKYILKSDLDEIKQMPQYIDAKKYLDKFYKSLLNNHEELEKKYEILKQEYENKELINKYYFMFNSENIFVDDVDEVKSVFDILDISLEDRIETLIIILKKNNCSYQYNNLDNSFKDIDEEEVLKILKENNNLKSSEYNELLEAVSEYVDIRKDVNDVIDESLVDKINISNILLAKKVWLYRKLDFLFNNMNCEKCNKILLEYKNVDNLYESTRNIKNQKEVIGIIKGDE